ncbi:ABC transporter permease [Providencia rettgeri]|uniref:ABC transporter permease n=1 Tax=Providencia TaxID=586 RepID=UPI001B380153|nr:MULTISPECIES: FtsX-like permease family protein [Providencia]EHZ7764150.1 ABC transporter permease [Providencia rettgeri]EIJ7167292.1 ABC transporter permease [Providencia rettgeri]EJD6048524.1 ABC transporter permease [Providencia rettgeri]EJD6477747.1 ABC transporter permease [Providencia rettgeri]ELH9585632.1 ABC transporter permease [Providencia rettgeri]
MMNVLFWISNAIITYALLVVIITAIRKPTDIRYTFLNLFRQSRRSAVTLLAITLGGVAVFIFGGFVDYSFWALREQTIRTNLGHIQLYEKGYLTSGANNSLQYTISNYDEVKNILIADPQIGHKVSTITGQLSFTGIISQYEKGASTFFTGVGIEPQTSLVLGSLDRIISGSDLSRVEPQEITIGSGISDSLSARYDDWVDMLVVNPEGGQNAMSSKVRGVFQSGIKEYDDTSIKMPLKTAQRLLQTNDVSKIIILLQDTSQTKDVLARINQLIIDHNLPLEARAWDDLAIFYHQVVNLFEGIFLFIKSIVSIIVVFMIGNTLMMNVVERTREIATLRALGLSQPYIGRLFVLEGVIIGIIGSVLSISFGILIASLININGIPMPPSPGYTQGYLAFVLWNQDMNLFWFSCALPLVTALIASIIPAHRASKLVIAEAFRFV